MIDYTHPTHFRFHGRELGVAEQPEACVIDAVAVSSSSIRLTLFDRLSELPTAQHVRSGEGMALAPRDIHIVELPGSDSGSFFFFAGVVHERSKRVHRESVHLARVADLFGRFQSLLLPQRATLHCPCQDGRSATAESRSCGRIDLSGGFIVTLNGTSLRRLQIEAVVEDVLAAADRADVRVRDAEARLADLDEQQQRVTTGWTRGWLDDRQADEERRRVARERRGAEAVLGKARSTHESTDKYRRVAETFKAVRASLPAGVKIGLPWVPPYALDDWLAALTALGVTIWVEADGALTFEGVVESVNVSTTIR